VDIGATSIDVALTTLGSELVAHRGEPGDVRDGPLPILDRVKALLSELLDEQAASPMDVLAIGVGVPGPVEQASGLLTAPPIMPGWDRFPIRDSFAGEYAAPVFVDNDVNVMALGEHWGGVAKGVDDMIFVKIGTGIGSGIIIGGHPTVVPRVAPGTSATSAWNQKALCARAATPGAWRRWRRPRRSCCRRKGAPGKVNRRSS
jgi:predicted NBD/HSP70 family sugar kinase